MSYLSNQRASVDDFDLVANELLVQGNFSNLAYSNVQSSLAGSRAEQDLVRDFLHYPRKDTLLVRRSSPV